MRCEDGIVLAEDDQDDEALIVKGRYWRSTLYPVVEDQVQILVSNSLVKPKIG